jgi:hypothetical protein
MTACPYLCLDEAAAADFLGWRTDLERRLRAGDLSPAVEGHLAKYRKQVPALALINHIVDGGRGPVSLPALLKALSLTHYLESRRRHLRGGHIRRSERAACFRAPKRKPPRYDDGHG